MLVQSDDAVLLFEPGRYPVAYFPRADFADGVLEPTDRRTEHHDLGPTVWFNLAGGTRDAERAAWQHLELPASTPACSRAGSRWPGGDRRPRLLRARPRRGHARRRAHRARARAERRRPRLDRDLSIDEAGGVRAVVAS
jgi:hypothetical protein